MSQRPMSSRPSRKTATHSSSLRIIGGEWRGRRLQFPEVEGLRPTPDRVRETLFNWLQPLISGARCLDLFAGSGALGLEALSRGAAHLEFVDRNRRVTDAIRQHLVLLREEARAVVHVSDAMGFLCTPPKGSFDIVFLDPPYHANLLAPAAAALESGGWLAEGARIYLECDLRQGLPPLPENWEIVRDGKAGQVGFYLAARR